MKKIISFIVLALVAGVLSLSTASAQNIGSLQGLVTPGFSFKVDLRLGDTDPAVRELQRVLNADIDTVVTYDGDGARGKETTYFGEKTKLAVIKFQNKYKDVILTPAGLTVGNGLVNKLTRTKLNLLIGVINTVDSVGLPQNRASTVTTTTYTPPAQQTVIVSTPQPQMSVCQFIELLISIDAIRPEKISQARSVYAGMSCASSGPTPMVDIRANGKSGVLRINSPQDVELTLTSANVTSCSNGSGPVPTSGTKDLYINRDTKVTVTCSGPYGNVVDEVTIVLVTPEDNNNPFFVTCSPNLNSVITGNLVTWTASTTGGTGSYTYSWSGTDGLTGTSRTASKNYSTVGYKNAQVTVTSGARTLGASCFTAVNSATTTSRATTTATTSKPVDVDLKVERVSDESNQYMVSWEAENSTTCTASSFPSVSGWNNQVKTNVGFEMITVDETTTFSLLCRNNVYSDYATGVAEFTDFEALAEAELAEEEALSGAGGGGGSFGVMSGGASSTTSTSLPGNWMYGEVESVTTCTTTPSAGNPNGVSVFRVALKPCLGGSTSVYQPMVSNSINDPSSLTGVPAETNPYATLPNVMSHYFIITPNKEGVLNGVMMASTTFILPAVGNTILGSTTIDKLGCQNDTGVYIGSARHFGISEKSCQQVSTSTDSYLTGGSYSGDELGGLGGIQNILMSAGTSGIQGCVIGGIVAGPIGCVVGGAIGSVVGPVVEVVEGYGPFSGSNSHDHRGGRINPANW